MCDETKTRLSGALRDLACYAIELELEVSTLKCQLERWMPTGDPDRLIKCHKCGLHYRAHVLVPSFHCVGCGTEAAAEGGSNG